MSTKVNLSGTHHLPLVKRHRSWNPSIQVLTSKSSIRSKCNARSLMEQEKLHKNLALESEQLLKYSVYSETCTAERGCSQKQPTRELFPNGLDLWHLHFQNILWIL
nr:uncharacterized protein LOC112017701 [Quercus suber]POF26890.1 hypothetical protein CFP56_37667 [Quercus suber]